METSIDSISARFVGLANLGADRDLLLEVLRTLSEVIPSAMVSYNEISRDDGRTRGRTFPEDWLERHAHLMPVFERWHHQHPLAFRLGVDPHGHAARWSDGDHETFQRSELYNQFMLPCKTRHQLCFSLPSHAGFARGFALCREREDFTDEEVALCNEIAPYLVVLFSSAAKTAMSFVHGLASERWTAVVVDHAGNPIGKAWPKRFDPTEDGALSAQLRLWVRAVLKTPDTRLDSATATTLRDSSNNQVYAQLVPDITGSHVLLISSPGIAPWVSELFTPRQVEALHQLLAGGSSQHIAQRMGISPETVKKHLGVIYRTLGVSDRASALAAVLATAPPTQSMRPASSGI